MAGAGMKLVGDWKKAKEVTSAAPADLEKALEAAVLAVAEFFVGKLKKKISSGVEPANKPLTILMKGGKSKPLVNKGDMRNSIRVVKAGKFEAFVGIPASARSKGGQSYVNIASVLEKGAIIVQSVTDKQRRFFFGVLAKKSGYTPTAKEKGGSGILIIHIPPRPFIEPTFEEHSPQAGELMGKRVIANLKKLGGK
jgi:hypothetical protein